MKVSSHASAPGGFEETCLETLRSRGFSLTRPRRAIVSLLGRTRQLLTARELEERLAMEGEPVDRASVFRTLAVLMRQGLVHHSARLGGYVGCQLPHSSLAGHAASHHLLVCNTCRGVVEVDIPGLLKAAVGRGLEFEPDEHAVEVPGTCRRCRGRG
ncbi:MAG: transcriptional repressor [Myxococcota bacterium]